MYRIKVSIHDSKSEEYSDIIHLDEKVEDANWNFEIDDNVGPDCPMKHTILHISYYTPKKSRSTVKDR